MNGSLLRDAFGHHAWATIRLLDACAALTPEQLRTAVPGTYGSILDTLRHLGGADASYLNVLSAGAVERIDEDAMDLGELRAAVERFGPAWLSLLESDLDPDAIVVRHRDDGSETHAPIGIRLAQALHHGTDHRSQVCTALTTLGIEPPAIDVWDYAAKVGRLTEIEPSA
ncbi:MAG TPA: DinB family protein [Candidatus Dormibacteraeota bacterium]|nr:DinB family protein [Candidatus Dormibacteraeota bacterium]